LRRGAGRSSLSPQRISESLPVVAPTPGLPSGNSHRDRGGTPARRNGSDREPAGASAPDPMERTVMTSLDSFKCRKTLKVGAKTYA